MTKPQKFGGTWSTVKLAALRSYLGAYGNVMKNQPFTTHYADAFAGTGSHVQSGVDSQASFIPLEEIKGSVQIALDNGSLHHYHFNDLNSENVLALEEIKRSNPEKKIHVTGLDANDFIIRFCSSLTKKDRAVLFIDPFATQVEWSTLEVIAATGKIDLWLLFPFSSFSRLTPKGGPSPLFNKKVTGMLGDEEWLARLYAKPQPGRIDDMFGGSQEAEVERVSQDNLANFITEKLERVFAFASQPLHLKNSKGSSLFLLYFAMSNRSEKAVKLAKKIVSSVLKQPGLQG